MSLRRKPGAAQAGSSSGATPGQLSIRCASGCSPKTD